MDYLLPDKAYRALKWVALIVLPALATLVGAVGTAWGWPHLTAVISSLDFCRRVDRREQRQRENARKHGNTA